MEFIKLRWKTLLGVIFVWGPLWPAVKPLLLHWPLRLLEWAEHTEFLWHHGGPMIDFVVSPPLWTNWVMGLGGLGLILWDQHRRHEAGAAAVSSLPRETKVGKGNGKSGGKTVCAPAPSPPAPQGDAFSPRMERLRPPLVRNAEELFALLAQDQRPVLHIQTWMDESVRRLALELFDLVQQTIWDMGEWAPYSEDEASRAQRKMQELFVSLKGNDIHVYAAVHTKTLPERWEPSVSREGLSWERQVIIAFGPPLPPTDPDTEGRVEVLVDNGQPCLIPRDPVF